jgi:hypothetical protein
MRTAKPGKSVATWLGLLAIALNLIAPLGAGGTGHARADARIGICTASGLRFVPEAPQAPSHVPTPAERLQCTLCTHCAPSGGHAALGPGLGAAPAWPERASAPPPHAHSHSTVHWIPGARPRAPPAPFAVL